MSSGITDSVPNVILRSGLAGFGASGTSAIPGRTSKTSLPGAIAAGNPTISSTVRVI